MRINIVIFSSISFVRKSYKTSDSKHDLDIKPTEKCNLKGLKSVLSKICATKSEGGGSVSSDFKKLDSFTLETSKNHLIRSFLRNGRLRVKHSPQATVIWWRSKCLQPLSFLHSILDTQYQHRTLTLYLTLTSYLTLT